MAVGILTVCVGRLGMLHSSGCAVCSPGQIPGNGREEDMSGWIARNIWAGKLWTPPVAVNVWHPGRMSDDAKNALLQPVYEINRRKRILAG